MEGSAKPIRVKFRKKILFAQRRGGAEMVHIGPALRAIMNLAQRAQDWLADAAIAAGATSPRLRAFARTNSFFSPLGCYFPGVSNAATVAVAGNSPFIASATASARSITRSTLPPASFATSASLHPRRISSASKAG